MRVRIAVGVSVVRGDDEVSLAATSNNFSALTQCGAALKNGAYKCERRAFGSRGRIAISLQLHEVDSGGQAPRPIQAERVADTSSW